MSTRRKIKRISGIAKVSRSRINFLSTFPVSPFFFFPCKRRICSRFRRSNFHEIYISFSLILSPCLSLFSPRYIRRTLSATLLASFMLIAAECFRGKIESMGIHEGGPDACAEIENTVYHSRDSSGLLFFAAGGIFPPPPFARPCCCCLCLAVMQSRTFIIVFVLSLLRLLLFLSLFPPVLPSLLVW